MTLEICKLSVILPIYNGMPYLRDSINSLLNQTFHNFVVYAIDNGSTDGTQEYISGLKNPQIIYIRLKEKNFVKALNVGLDLVNTPFVARMDSDDISHPSRFEKQIKFLEKNDKIKLVGSNGQYINTANNRHLDINVPLSHEEIIQSMLKSRNAIIHASIMFRYDIIRLYGKYDTNYFPCEDYELFLRIGDKIKFANIPDRLYQFRITENSILAKSIKESIKLYYHISSKYSPKYNNSIYDINTKYFQLNIWQELDVISLSIYRKGLNYYLNKNKIIGYYYFLIASFINPSRLFYAIKKKMKTKQLVFIN